ncbi:MAG: copper transporter, partial [Frankiaceae bacterium]|nr:copper transporter [Frankiaceae bacterium]
MVDFRYHLVSIIAVFLALAVGIVVGTAALNGPIVDSLRGNINRLSDDKRDLEQDVRQLQGEVGAADDFADAVGPDLLAGALADERLLFVTTDGVPDGLVEQLRPVLESAGASVTGRLDVRPALADPENRALVEGRSGAGGAGGGGRAAARGGAARAPGAPAARARRAGTPGAPRASTRARFSG